MSNKKITPFLATVFYLAYPLIILCFIALIWLAPHSNTDAKPTGLFITLVLLMVVLGWAWIISLGIVASRLGKSWILWCGLSIIFSPISPLIIYIIIGGNINNALNQSMDAKSETT